MSPAEQHLDGLRRDLLDGDDLALAMTLIGDVLHRRLVRVRRSLEHVDGADDGLLRRIAATVDRFETEFTASHERMQEIISSFQDLLELHGEELTTEADPVTD